MPEKPDVAAEPEFALTFPEEVIAFVKERYSQASAILEYGSGGSTMLAAECGKPCHAVESDAKWAKMLTERLENRFDGQPSAQVVHVDIGPTKKWGYPQNSEKWVRYWRYPMSIWDAPTLEQPDLVLIDGRMRQACFAATMLKIQHETTVLFDDYADRPRYHAVEQFVKPDLFVGRMAQFTLQPGMLTIDAFADILPWFFVMR